MHTDRLTGGPTKEVDHPTRIAKLEVQRELAMRSIQTGLETLVDSKYITKTAHMTTIVALEYLMKT